MPKGLTLMGKPFEYEGSLERGITVIFDRSGTALTIKRGTIDIIRREIESRSPVLMGANRQPLVQNSVGETLYRDYGISPQVMSYALPLLIDEGFCTVSNGRPFVIYAARNQRIRSSSRLSSALSPVGSSGIAPTPSSSPGATS
ncbi:MAG: hypothetical protein ACYC7C_03940 [Coriobacteriia bacterium]